MPRRSRITKDLSDQICTWREEGRTVPWIMERLKDAGASVGAGAIAWHLMVSGADLPESRRHASRWKPGIAFNRGGRPVRTYTPDEDAKLLALNAEGLSLSSIARLLHRSKSSVQGRLVTLARKAEREAG